MRGLKLGGFLGRAELRVIREHRADPSRPLPLDPVPEVSRAERRQPPRIPDDEISADSFAQAEREIELLRPDLTVHQQHEPRQVLAGRGRVRDADAFVLQADVGISVAAEARARLFGAAKVPAAVHHRRLPVRVLLLQLPQPVDHVRRQHSAVARRGKRSELQVRWRTVGRLLLDVKLVTGPRRDTQAVVQAVRCERCGQLP